MRTYLKVRFTIFTFLDNKISEDSETKKKYLALEVHEAAIAQKIAKMYERKCNMKKSAFARQRITCESDESDSSTEEEDLTTN